MATMHIKYTPAHLLKTVLFLFCLSVMAACTHPATKAYNKGVKKQAAGENDVAIEYYKISLEKGGSKARLKFLIAENYRITNRIQESTPFYAEAIKAKTKEDRALYYYAQGLEAQGNYIEARINYESYARKGNNKQLVRQAKAKADFLRQIHVLLNKETFYNVKNAGEYINTEGPEYGPTVGPEGEIIYTASNNQFTYKATGTGFTDIYTFKPDGALEGSGVKKSFNDLINDNATHEACPTMSPDGTYIVFVRSNDGKRKGGIDTDLYFIEMRDGDWSKPEVLPFSDPRSWESTPAFSPDGKTLYFSSNRRGGFGGIDLYKVTMTDSGWTKPKNMGAKINTTGNEMFPYTRPDGKFFFASDGHPGLGGLDIFVLLNDSTDFDSTQTEQGIVNLGPPINTSADDFGIAYKPGFKNGYFSSNRPGGKGDDDIYDFWIAPVAKKPITKDITAFLTVLVTDKPDTENEKPAPLDSAKVGLVFESGEAFEDTLTNKTGQAAFEVDTNGIYNVLAEKKGYFSNNITFNVKSSKFREEAISYDESYRYYKLTIDLTKVVVGKEIVLQNIFYDYNKADIRADAEPDLQMLIDFMKKNPEVVIELGSHTDSRGNDDYNQKLSLARAKSAVDYIVENGIEKDRIVPIGYGETKHVIEDAQTEEEHQKNRRTEFKVVKM